MEQEHLLRTLQRVLQKSDRIAARRELWDRHGIKVKLAATLDPKHFEILIDTGEDHLSIQLKD